MDLIAFQGNLVRDAHISDNRDGSQTALFTVAVNKRSKGNDGEWRDSADFRGCSLWRSKDASKKVFDYLVKGQQVIVQGRPYAKINTNKQTGEQRPELAVDVSSLDLVGKRPAKEQPAEEAKADENPDNNPPF